MQRLSYKLELVRTLSAAINLTLKPFLRYSAGEASVTGAKLFERSLAIERDEIFQNEELDDMTDDNDEIVDV